MIGLVLRARYELTNIIQEGPIFAHYAARDKQVGRDVSIRLVKSPFAREPEFLRALTDAAHRQSHIQQPNIETLSELFVDGDHAFLVSNLNRGPTLMDRTRKLAPFSVPVALNMAISLCKGLMGFHKAGLIHGDLTAQNAVIMGDGEVKIQMGGIWTAYSASPTAGVMILPSMAPFLAPEVTEGAMPSRQSDVYAIGVILFELLTGRPPYEADTPVALVLQHVRAPLPTARTLNPSVQPVLDEIVKKAMAKSPADRYLTAQDLLADLRKLSDALRFGKTLNWPIETSGITQSPKKATEQKGVAPRMSALRTEEEIESMEKRGKRERDVPIWMLALLGLMLTGVAAIVIIWMAMNLSKPKRVSVPNLKGLTLNEARSVLATSKLELKIEKREENEQVEADRILDARPKSGERVTEGSRIQVTVSDGSRMVEVPDLRGQTIDKARQLLNQLSLDADVVVYGRPGVDALVTRTAPPSRARVKRGTKIKVFAGLDEQAKTPAPGDPGKGNVYTVEIPIARIAEDSRLKVEVTDEKGTRTCYEETHGPGNPLVIKVVAFGPEAVFRVYVNDRMTMRITKAASDAVPEP